MDIISSFIQLSPLLFECILLVIIVSNLKTLRRLQSYPLPKATPFVSILVPARNEAVHILACVESLLAQNYPHFEVIVLDDHSTDDTWGILSELAEENDRLRIQKGNPLPAGWLGKHWACHQLAQLAQGALFLFTDADTRHHPQMLINAVAALEAEEAHLLTAIPREEVVSWGEKLVVPIIPWSVFSIIPLVLAQRIRWPFLSATIGQLMLFERQAFFEIGGYEAVRQNVIDDIALGRNIKRAGFRWRLFDATERVSCRMYQNFTQVLEGISKNLFATFNYSVPAFSFVWLWIGYVFLSPLFIAVLLLGGAIPGLSLSLALLAIAMALLIWGILYWRFHFPLYLTLFYPVTVFLSVIIAARSMTLYFKGQTTWKGRTLYKPSVVKND